MSATTSILRRARVGGRRAKKSDGSGLGVVGAIALVIVVLAALTAIFGPLLAPHDPNASSLSAAYVGPGSGHPLGYDGQGRDLLSRLLAGARTSLLGPLLVVGLSMTVGVLLAVVAAWRGGWVDSCISAFLDALFAFPGILLAILATALFGVGVTAASIALALAYMPYVARTVRSSALRERAQEYVAALEVQGASAVVICLRHLVPNVGSLIVAQATILFGYAMVDLAAISYIGLGVQPPQADWGVMVADGQSGLLQGYPAESLAAGGAIVIVVIAFNILGARLSGHTEEVGI
jgi:peptide/nickel transport system permease protein